MNRLHSYSRVALELGIDRRSVPLLVRALGLVPKPVPTNGRAKGLDDEDLRRLREALDLEPSSAA